MNDKITSRERAIRQTMLKLDEEIAPRMGRLVRWRFDDGSEVACSVDMSGDYMRDEWQTGRARRDVAEHVVDYRAKLREMRISGRTYTEQLEADLRKSKQEIETMRAAMSEDSTRKQSSVSLLEVVSDLTREIYRHTMAPPVSIHIDIRGHEWHALAARTSQGSPPRGHPELGFRLDLAPGGEHLMCPVLISPGDEGHPDFPPYIDERPRMLP